MPLLFLDIDGVLNCTSTRERFSDVVGIEPEKVAILKRILNETEAQVVLSSTWRFDQDWRSALLTAGLPLHHFIGVTDRAKSRIRGEEIQAWINEHGVTEKYAILDDDTDMLPGQPHFKTTSQDGLTNEIADAVIRYLNATVIMPNTDKTQSPSPKKAISWREAKTWDELPDEPLPTDGTVESFVTFHKNPYQKLESNKKE